MIEKSCLDCGHKKICIHFRMIKEMILRFVQKLPEMSDVIYDDTLYSAATCFGTICIDWLSKSKLGERK